MRIKSKNKYVLHLVAWLFRIPIRSVKFIYHKELVDDEVSELAWLKQNRDRFSELSAEMIEKLDEAIEKAS